MLFCAKAEGMKKTESQILPPFEGKVRGNLCGGRVHELHSRFDPTVVGFGIVGPFARIARNDRETTEYLAEREKPADRSGDRKK